VYKIGARLHLLHDLQGQRHRLPLRHGLRFGKGLGDGLGIREGLRLTIGEGLRLRHGLGNHQAVDSLQHDHRSFLSSAGRSGFAF
jgi:hypothetical protein